MNLKFLPAIVPVEKNTAAVQGRVILAQFNYRPLFAQPGLTNGLITGANIGARERTKGGGRGPGVWYTSGP